MDPTLPLVLLAVLSVGLGLWDLVKHRGKDVVPIAVMLELGLVLGALFALFLPAGFYIGAIGGFALAATEFKALLRGRIRSVERRALREPDEASGRLVVHNRLDALTSSAGAVRRSGLFLSLGFLTLVGTGLLGWGMLSGLRVPGAAALLLGALALFLPAVQGLRFLADREERRALERRFLEAPGGELGPDGSLT